MPDIKDDNHGAANERSLFSIEKDDAVENGKHKRRGKTSAECRTERKI